VAFVAKEERCLVDEDSEQPALEGSFVLELRRIDGGRTMTVSNCVFGCIDGGEDATGYEMKHLSTVQELLIEAVSVEFTISFETANIRNADGLIGFRWATDVFTGSVSHEHKFLSLIRL
jgi:hypothetical protein